MSTDTLELPLFPLNVVLFPGAALPLHIFEPRYRQMIKDCQRTEQPFGIVLAKTNSVYLHEEPYAIGTIAEICNLNRLADGSYDLIALGARRFHILSQHNELPYLSAVVEYYDDEPAPADTLTPLADQVRHLFDTYLNMLLDALDEKDVVAHLPSSPENLSHFIGHFLEIDDAEKQKYLELTSTQQRLQSEMTILRREIPFLRQIFCTASLPIVLCSISDPLHIAFLF